MREQRADSLLGPLPVHRHYDHCRACREGFFPRDRQLQLSSAHLTPAASEAVSIAGLQTSFAQAAETTLQKLCGLRLSESTVERTTEAAGARLQELQEEKVVFGQEQVWDWQRDARGRTCAYVSLDATGVRQQGERGAKAEGRMAYVGLVYNPRSAHDEKRPAPHSVRYLSGFYTLQELGLQLRRQAAQVGWDDAQQQLALSDGGAGLEEFFRQNFPRAECILDFWHAGEHLTELAATLYADEAERAEQAQAWRRRLKREGGLSIVRLLQALDAEWADGSSSARAALADCLRYFQNHQHKMDYPRYVENGWQIGSGPVESACKTVVGNRLKGGGMRWGADGSDALCRLRALYLSQPGGWEMFWKNHPN